MSVADRDLPAQEEYESDERPEIGDEQALKTTVRVREPPERKSCDWIGRNRVPWPLQSPDGVDRR